MHKFLLLTAILTTLAACSSHGEDDAQHDHHSAETSRGADAGTRADASQEETPAPDATLGADARASSPACPELPSGTWQARGSCFGMTMTAKLDFDPVACTFTIGDWNMVHGNLPQTGAVWGTDVTLAGGDFTGCTGEVDGTTLSGICPDGCAWEFRHGG